MADKPPPLTPDQIATLQDFARRHGREWKNYLRAAWAGQTYKSLRPNDSGTLRTLRNTHGPSWLNTFRLPS